MDKARKSLLTQELSAAEGAVLNVIRNSDAFVRVQTLYATLDKGIPGVYIGVDPASNEVVILELRKELRTVKGMLTKATKLAVTKPETIKTVKPKSKKKTTKKK